MGTEYVLVRDDNKEMYDLSKNPQGIGTWYEMENAFDSKSVLLDALPSWGHVNKFVISDLDYLKEYMLEGSDSDILEYWKNTLEDIYDWSDEKEVYIVFEEVEFQLKEKGYKTTRSRFKKNNNG